MLGTLALALIPAVLGAAGPFGPEPLSPSDYVMEKTKQHPIVLLGEAMWVEEEKNRADALTYRKWQHLKSWRQACGTSGPPSSR